MRSASAEPIQQEGGTGLSASAAACTSQYSRCLVLQAACDRGHPDADTFVLPGNHRTGVRPLRGPGARHRSSWYRRMAQRRVASRTAGGPSPSRASAPRQWVSDGGKVRSQSRSTSPRTPPTTCGRSSRTSRSHGRRRPGQAGHRRTDPPDRPNHRRPPEWDAAIVEQVPTARSPGPPPPALPTPAPGTSSRSAPIAETSALISGLPSAAFGGSLTGARRGLVRRQITTLGGQTYFGTPTGHAEGTARTARRVTG